MDGDLTVILSEVLLRLAQLEAQNKELLKAVKQSTPSTDEWLDTAAAATALKPSGIRSLTHLRELLYRGVFSAENGEIRNTGTAAKATWQFHVPSCQKAIAYYYSLPEYQRNAQFKKRVA